MVLVESSDWELISEWAAWAMREATELFLLQIYWGWSGCHHLWRGHRGDQQEVGEEMRCGWSGRRGANGEGRVKGRGGDGRHNGKAITALRSREKLAVFSESESLYVKIQKWKKGASLGLIMRVLWASSSSVHFFLQWSFAIPRATVWLSEQCQSVSGALRTCREGGILCLRELLFKKILKHCMIHSCKQKKRSKILNYR